MSANSPKSDEAHTPASGTGNTAYNHVSGILSTNNTQSYEAHTSAIGTEHDESNPDTGDFDFRNYNPWGAVVSHSKKPGYDPLGAVFTPAQITVGDGDEEPLPYLYQPHFRFRYFMLEACDNAQIVFNSTSIKDGERALFHFGMSERVLRDKVPCKHTMPLSKEWHLARCEELLVQAQTHFGKARDSFFEANIAMKLAYEDALAAMDAPSLDEVEFRQGRSDGRLGQDGQPPSKQSGEAIAEHRADLTTTDCGVSEQKNLKGTLPPHF